MNNGDAIHFVTSANIIDDGTIGTRCGVHLTYELKAHTIKDHIYASVGCQTFICHSAAELKELLMKAYDEHLAGAIDRSLTK